MSVVAGHQKLTAISWEHYWSWFSYSYVRSCWRTQHQPFYSLRHLKKIGKVRKLGKWVRHELTADKKKIIILKCGLLLFCAPTMNHFSIRLWQVTKSGFYVTAGDDQLHGWTEKKLQSTFQGQTCTQKRSWSVFDGCLVVCWQSDSVQVSES